MPGTTSNEAATRAAPRITRHAVERYIERIKPALGEVTARCELEALLAQTEIVERPPAWVEWRIGMTYHVLSDGIIAVQAANGYVTTILIRGGCSERTRARRKSRRIQKREARRHEDRDRFRPRRRRELLASPGFVS